MEIKRDVYLDKLIRVSVYQGSQDEAWDDYLVYGGLPLILTMEEAEEKAGFRQIEETHLMENIIYNELRVRGYHVDVGVVEYYETKADGKRGKKQLEVNFVATKGSEEFSAGRK